MNPPKPQMSDNGHNGPLEDGLAVLFKQGQMLVVKSVIPGIACIQAGNLAPILINTSNQSPNKRHKGPRGKGVEHTFEEGPINGLNEG